MSIDYENPWLYLERPFNSDDVGDNYGFVYNITNLTNGRQYIGRKYFWSHRKPPGKKRRVKKESDWKKYYGSCPELKEDIERLGRQNFSRTILSLHKTAGKTNFEETRQLFIHGVLTESLDTEDQHTTIATSSADTSEKITMMETEEIVAHVRDWAMERVDDLNKKGVRGIYDQMALIDEFHEWFNPLIIKMNSKL